MENLEFKNIEECKNYLNVNNLKKLDFYFNFYGWDFYYSLNPTFATPSGKNKLYPRKCKILNK